MSDDNVRFEGEYMDPRYNWYECREHGVRRKMYIRGMVINDNRRSEESSNVVQRLPGEDQC